MKKNPLLTVALCGLLLCGLAMVADQADATFIDYDAPAENSEVIVGCLAVMLDGHTFQLDLDGTCTPNLASTVKGDIWNSMTTGLRRQPESQRSDQRRG